MIMVRESESHRQMASATAKIGRHPITADNKDHESFRQFREKRRTSGEDPSKKLFKYTTDK